MVLRKLQLLLTLFSARLLLNETVLLLSNETEMKIIGNVAFCFYAILTKELDMHFSLKN